jgi:hypothetical protein
LGLTGGNDVAKEVLTKAEAAMISTVEASKGTGFLMPNARAAMSADDWETAWTVPTGATMTAWLALTNAENSKTYLWWGHASTYHTAV